MSKQPNETKVYVLIDPLTGEIRYVGKTNNTEIRLRNHIRNARKNIHKQHVYSWINQLLDQALSPEIKVIEEHLTDKQANVQEIFWIKYYKDVGSPLTNMTDGGDGQTLGFKFSVEQRQKLSKIHKGRSITWGDKISLAKKGKKNSIEHNNHLSEALIGHIPWNKGKKTGPLSLDHRLKLSETGKKNWRNQHAKAI